MAVTNFDIISAKVPVAIKTASYTISAGESGTVFGMATDAKVFTLPATEAGLTYTFVNMGADGNNIITISPAAVDGIFGGVHGAATGDLVSFSGTDDKDAINTKATALKGDYLTLVGDGVNGWYVVAGKGVWASQG